MMQETKTKTSRGTGEVRIMSPAELRGKRLYDRANEMAQNRYDVFITNVKYIQSQRGITQAYMCEHDLEDLLKSPQLSAYRDRDRDIPYLAMVRLATAYGYTPEQLTGQLLEKQGGKAYDPEKTPPRPYDEYMKYVGTYHMAYFNTDAKPGSNKRTTARSLSSGLLTIYADGTQDGIPVLKAIAFTNCTEEERSKLLATVTSAEASQSIRGIRECYSRVAMAQKEGSHETPRAKCFYEGDVELNQHIARITIRQVKGCDSVIMTMHNRAADSSEGSPYKGGLATFSSVSRGEEHMPCVQAGILTKRGFENVAKEEVAEDLYMGDPVVDVSQETRDVINCMKHLFPTDSSGSPLSQISDADKFSMLESYIEKKLLDVIKRNISSYFKISTADDSAIYQTYCR